MRTICGRRITARITMGANQTTILAGSSSIRSIPQVADSFRAVHPLPVSKSKTATLLCREQVRYYH
jgi:hypothetical protein